MKRHEMNVFLCRHDAFHDVWKLIIFICNTQVKLLAGSVGSVINFM